MYFLVYKITNLLNGKVYIGTHKTKNLDDNYMGSGKYLKSAILKNGLENFRKEILFNYDNAEDMFKKEAELVNEDFLTNENTYNLRIGGSGGFDYINKNGLSNNKHFNKENAKQYSLKAGEKVRFLLETSIEFKEKRIANCKKGRGNSKGFKGFKHDDETKKLMRESHAGKHIGEKNSQYGTIWITNDKENKKINNLEKIPDGWRKGRKIKGL
jgi:hypothetical protein